MRRYMPCFTNVKKPLQIQSCSLLVLPFALMLHCVVIEWTEVFQGFLVTEHVLLLKKKTNGLIEREKYGTTHKMVTDALPCNKTGFAFESVGETVKCNHSNESFWVVLSSGAIYYDLQTSSNAWMFAKRRRRSVTVSKFISSALSSQCQNCET